MPVSLVDDDCESAEAARLFAVADACGFRRISEASVAMVSPVCLVLKVILVFSLMGKKKPQRENRSAGAVDVEVNVWLNAVPLGLT